MILTLLKLASSTSYVQARTLQPFFREKPEVRAKNVIVQRFLIQNHASSQIIFGGHKSFWNMKC